MIFNRCPNCGKKGLFETKNCFSKEDTHKCKYCDMEFKKVMRKGELVWRGNIPRFSAK